MNSFHIAHITAQAACLFIAAMVAGHDQTDRFIGEGIWEHGFDDDRIAAQVRSMCMGERFEKILEAG